MTTRGAGAGCSPRKTGHELLHPGDRKERRRHLVRNERRRRKQLVLLADEEIDPRLPQLLALHPLPLTMTAACRPSGAALRRDASEAARRSAIQAPLRAAGLPLGPRMSGAMDWRSRRAVAAGAEPDVGATSVSAAVMLPKRRAHEHRRADGRGYSARTARSFSSALACRRETCICETLRRLAISVCETDS